MNDKEIKTETKLEEITPDQTFFSEIVKSHLPEETIKEKIGDLKEAKGQRVEPIKTATDQEKIAAYDNLETKGLPEKDLPADWKAKLLRLKHLENELSNYTQVKEELKGWTDIFKDKKPLQVEEEIQSLETELEKTKKEAAEKIKGLEEDLDKSVKESQNILTNLGREIKELEQELNEWKQTWNNQELKEVQAEWKKLKERPDIAITTQQFYDDYASRKPLDQSEEEAQELSRAKLKVEEYQHQIKDLWETISQYLESERTKRYVLAEPIVSPEKAQQKIGELLAETSQKWREYLNDEGDPAYKDTKLIFVFRSEENKKRAYDILKWIEEAQESKDYQGLYEKWCDGKEYNEKYDFDGSLNLLRAWLEVKEDEPVSDTSASS